MFSTVWAWVLLCGVAALLAYRRSVSKLPGIPLVGFEVKDPKQRKGQYTFNAPGIVQVGYEKVRSFILWGRYSGLNNFFSSKTESLAWTQQMVRAFPCSQHTPRLDVLTHQVRGQTYFPASICGRDLERART